LKDKHKKKTKERQHYSLFVSFASYYFLDRIVRYGREETVKEATKENGK
jgi:hypothetical protein